VLNKVYAKIKNVSINFSQFLTRKINFFKAAPVFPTAFLQLEHD